jgi:hypothetical protein
MSDTTPEERLSAWAESPWKQERPPAAEDVLTVLCQLKELRQDTRVFARALIDDVEGMSNYLASIQALIMRAMGQD